MLKLGTTLVVALAYAAIAFADGGFSTELIAAGGIVIWWVVGVGVLARWWRGGEPVPRLAVIAGAMLAALSVWTALSMLWAGDAGRAFTEAVRISAYLGVFALVVLAARTAGPRPVLTGLALGLAAVAAAALATRLFPGAFGTDDPAIYAALPSDQGRLSFPIGYWNGLGACMGALIVLLAWLAAVARTVPLRALASAFIPVPVLVIYFASSRGGYAAAAIGVLVLVLLGPRRRSRVLGSALLGVIGGGALAWLASGQPDLVDGLNTESAQDAGLWLAAALVGVAIAIAITWSVVEPRLDAIRMRRPSARVIIAIAAVAVVAVAVVVNPIERVEEFTEKPAAVEPGEANAAGELLRGSGSGRYQYWEAAADAFSSDPLTGIGGGNYELWWNANGGLDRTISNAHSLYIETLAELGVVGFLLLLAFVAVLVLAVYRGLRDSISAEACAAAALVAAGLLSAALDWTWELSAVFVLVIAGAAILTTDQGEHVRAVGERQTREQTSALQRGDGFALGVATMAIAWASIWASAVLLLTEVKLDDSREAAGRGDYDAAVQDALDAGAVQPWSPGPPLQEAQVELLRGDIERARAAAREAVDLAPDDWRSWLVAARIEAAAGDAASYQATFGRASELAPVPLPPAEVVQQ